MDPTRDGHVVNANGRLFVSAGASIPHYAYAGRIRLDALAAAAQTGVFRNGHVLRPEQVAWTGAATARVWNDNPLRQSATGGDPFVDLLAVYGQFGDIVDIERCVRAVVVEDATMTSYQMAAATAMQSGDRAVADEAFQFSARAAYVVEMDQQLAQVHTLPAAVVAVAADGNDLYALTADLVDGNHELDLHCRIDGVWSEIGVGTFAPRTTGRYGLLLTQHLVLMAVEGGVYSLSRSAIAAGGVSGVFTVSGTPVDRMAAASTGNVVLLEDDGTYWRVNSQGQRIARKQVIGVGTAYSSGVAAAGESVWFSSSNGIFTQDEYGYRRAFPWLPGNATPIDAHTGRGLSSMIAFAAAGTVWESRNRGGAWSQIYAFPRACVTAAFASRSIAYAVVLGDPGGSNLWCSVSGARGWQMIGNGGSYPQLLCQATLPDGGVLLGGRTTPGGVGAPGEVVGAIFLFAPTKQMIAGL